MIQTASAEAAQSDRAEDRHFMLPHVQAAMKRFPDNIWLKFNLTKLLRGMGRIEEALKLAVEFAREKASEYWAWELIGDLVPNDIDLRRSCYATGSAAEKMAHPWTSCRVGLVSSTTSTMKSL